MHKYILYNFATIVDNVEKLIEMKRPFISCNILRNIVKEMYC